MMWDDASLVIGKLIDYVMMIVDDLLRIVVSYRVICRRGCVVDDDGGQGESKNGLEGM